MVDDCIKMGLQEPEYKYTFKTLQVTFQKTTPKTTKEKLILLIKANEKITRKEMADDLNITINGVKQHIANLKKENRLIRIGGRNHGIK